jgi:hypothetical protein
MNTTRPLAATLALLILVVLACGSAAAAPPPPPKFWSPARCERVMLHRPLAPARQVICVGTGGPATCSWTSGHRTRLYSEFRVFTRGQVNADGGQLYPNLVRSFTLATRARPGFIRVMSHWGDQYVGWPADFFRGPLTTLATDATPARFRSIVAPIAARLTQRENATGCAGG